MKYRLRSEPVEPHFWLPDHPHPAQEEAHEGDGVVIRVRGFGAGVRRAYLKPGYVILPTSLPEIFEVMTAEVFHKQYEPISQAEIEAPRFYD